MKKTRIMVADDHAVVRRGVRALLETHDGWEVCGEAATGAEAVEQVKRLNPDIAIMDISMPEINGLEAIRQINATAPEVGVLILTMHCSEPMFREAMEAGAQGHVLKSDLDERLIEAVEAVSEHRVFFTPSMARVIREGFTRGRGRARLDTRYPRSLTPRQRQIAQLLAKGKTNKEVASALGISVRTAEAHRRQIMDRLKIENLSELVLFAVRSHLVEL